MPYFRLTLQDPRGYITRRIHSSMHRQQLSLGRECSQVGQDLINSSQPFQLQVFLWLIVYDLLDIVPDGQVLACYMSVRAEPYRFVVGAVTPGSSIDQVCG